VKKFLLLKAAVAFVVLWTQALASPPVGPPPEGFTITSDTAILCKGKVSEREKFNWTYFEGKGILRALAGGPDDSGHAILMGPGFQEGAEIAYEQDFTAVDGVTYLLRSVAGYYTLFEKDFRATSHGVPNLAVRQAIGYNADPKGKGFAAHNEKVGLSVVSCGGGEAADFDDGLLSLCPWATGPGRETVEYPATNEGIAAGSSFRVTNLQSFTSESKVISTEVPALTYAVEAQSGRGLISAGFVVELWEGAAKWGSHDIGIHGVGQIPTGVYAVDDAPPVQSRTSYTEHVAAEGLWAFSKKAAYFSKMPGASLQDAVNPFALVP
jgi:hypothetical protein